MTTMQAYTRMAGQMRMNMNMSRAERRAHRRHELEAWEIIAERWEGTRRGGCVLGRVLDLSAGGIRIRTEQTGIRPDQQIRVRLELPAYAGICPFVDTTEESLRPKQEWIGWLNVSRVQRVDDRQFEIAGRLIDMTDMDRGMLGLYLSTQPLAA